MSKFPLQPLGDRVIVKVISHEKGERKTTGGIVIPDIAVDALPVTGEVLAIGNGVPDKGWRHPIAVGDHVLFGKYTVTKIEYPGLPRDVEHRSISVADIISVDRKGTGHG